MKERVPDVLDVLAAVAIPNVTAHEDSAKQIVPLCTVYGILMFNRWKELPVRTTQRCRSAAAVHFYGCTALKRL